MGRVKSIDTHTLSLNLRFDRWKYVLFYWWRTVKHDELRRVIGGGVNRRLPGLGSRPRCTPSTPAITTWGRRVYERSRAPSNPSASGAFVPVPSLPPAAPLSPLASSLAPTRRKTCRRRRRLDCCPPRGFTLEQAGSVVHSLVCLVHWFIHWSIHSFVVHSLVHSFIRLKIYSLELT